MADDSSRLERLVTLVEDSPIPLVVITEDRSELRVSLASRLGRDLSSSGSPFPLDRLEGWEARLRELDVGSADAEQVVVDGLDYGLRWDLDQNRTAWSVTIQRLTRDAWAIYAFDVTGQYRYATMIEETLASRNRAFEGLASVAHELKQPLTAIQGFAQMIAAETDDPNLAELSSLIGSESENLTLMVDDLVTSGLATSRRLRVETEAVSVEDVVAELERTAAGFVDRAVVVRSDRVSAGQRVIVDLRRLGQVVRGLIHNATKYGGPNIEAEIADVDGRCVVEVRDDGPGVPPEEVDTLFEAFQPGSAGRQLGTGIGLAVARSIVADMGGLLEYRPGSPGAVFSITLPTEESSTAAVPLHAAEEQAELLRELVEYEGDAARLRLNRLSFRHPATLVVDEVVHPVMYEIGERWEQGALTVAEEHHASSVVQSWLLDLMARGRAWRPHSVVCAAAPGGQHELGIAAVGVALAEAGYRVVYLGRSLPTPDLIDAVDRADASALLLSVTLPEQEEGLQRLAEGLERHLAEGLVLGIGGARFTGVDEPVDLPGVFLGRTAAEAVRNLGELLEERTAVPGRSV